MGLFDFWTSHPTGKVTPLVDPNMQTRELSDGSRVCKYLESDKLMDCMHSDSLTLYDAVRRGARVSNNGPMLGYRVKAENGTIPYVWLNYNVVIERSMQMAHAFRALGLPSGQQTFIGLYSKNRPEWIMVEQAAYAFNNVIVPLYETLGPEACSFILNQAEIELVVCDVVDKAIGLIKERSKCPSMKYVIVMENITPKLNDLAGQAGIKVLTLDDLERMGRDSVNKKQPEPPKPEDLATICYTSGTTGTPKGVMLTHGNVIADGTTLEYFKTTKVGKDDVMMSFLPLAHMFERVVQSVVYTVGGRVGFFRGDIRLLAEDIKDLAPTILPVVPRVLNRLYDKVMAEVNKSPIKKALFAAAMAYKTHELNNWIVRNNSFVDKLIFKKIRDGFGGRVKLMVTGSAPLSENVLTFVRCALGCMVVEGYGQTECVAAATITLEGDPKPGHVGVPSPCNAIKLVDVPELNYFVKDRAGEVCVKGTNVFKGYYKNAEQTSEVLDSDGWLHTGDIGCWTQNGTLKIVDRKKHIFKLAQGEYVAPEKIENVYIRSQYVAQIFVHGESLKTCLVGIVVPDPDVLPGAVPEKFKGKSIEELCSEPEVKQMIMDDMITCAKDAGLYSFEQVKDIYMCAEMFTVENDLLTPTLKSKRPNLKDRFKPQIVEMYKHLE